MWENQDLTWSSTAGTEAWLKAFGGIVRETDELLQRQVLNPKRPVTHDSRYFDWAATDETILRAVVETGAGAQLHRQWMPGFVNVWLRQLTPFPEETAKEWKVLYLACPDDFDFHALAAQWGIETHIKPGYMPAVDWEKRWRAANVGI